MHYGDKSHSGLCLGYVPALAYGSCRVSGQGTSLCAFDLHNAFLIYWNKYLKTYHEIHALYFNASSTRFIPIKLPTIYLKGIFIWNVDFDGEFHSKCHMKKEASYVISYEISHAIAYDIPHEISYEDIFHMEFSTINSKWNCIWNEYIFHMKVNTFHVISYKFSHMKVIIKT